MNFTISRLFRSSWIQTKFLIRDTWATSRYMKLASPKQYDVTDRVRNSPGQHSRSSIWKYDSDANGKCGIAGQWHVPRNNFYKPHDKRVNSMPAEMRSFHASAKVIIQYKFPTESDRCKISSESRWAWFYDDNSCTEWRLEYELHELSPALRTPVIASERISLRFKFVRNLLADEAMHATEL